MASVVIGGSGTVGRYIVEHLVASGEKPIVLTRSERTDPDINWFRGDLEEPLQLPASETIYCTASADLFGTALPGLISPMLKRVVVFTSTSLVTKMNSEIDSERVLLSRLANAERIIEEICGRAGIGWTILRPTLIYAEGNDKNITRMSHTIRKLRFMPLAGKGDGKRQPVHAEDLAVAAIAAARSPAAVNKVYSLAGTETITYREMVGRVFDGLGMPRVIVPLPVNVWKAAFAIAKPFFPDFNAAMGTRMSQDMTFDTAPAQRDLAWSPREFRPRF